MSQSDGKLAVQYQPNGIAARAIAARAADGLPIDRIRVDGGTQSRANLQDSVIDEYAEAMRAGVEFPPIVVFYDGTDHWLADGFHRLRAFDQAGFNTIPADIRQGTRRDAILYSVGANEAHGLRRTNDDKRRAVLTLLNDAEWSEWSDREIARQCAVGHQMVAPLRAGVTGRATSERTYTTKHGTKATMNTAAIGKKECTGGMENTAPCQEKSTLAVGKINVPEGVALDVLARQCMAREADGENSEKIAKESLLGTASYRQLCDVVFLFDRAGYSAPDTEIVDEAFDLAVNMRRISDARELIDPVAQRVWGTSKARRQDREPERVKQFELALGILLQQCMTTDEIEVPYLSAEEAKKIARRIGGAKGALQRFAQKIMDIHK